MAVPRSEKSDHRYVRRSGPQQSLAEPVANTDGGNDITLEDLLPSPDEGPEAAFAHGVLVDELTAAIEDLPPEQRLVFVAHEIEGRSFRNWLRKLE